MRTRLIALAVLGVSGIAHADFTSDERGAILTYWSDPSRYSVSASFDPGKPQLWVIRATPESSAWFARLRLALKLGRDTSSFDHGGPWDTWIDARMAMDRWQAESYIASSMGKVIGQPDMAPPARPADPGVMPDDLWAMSGNPPRFYAPYIAQRYIVTFDDGTVMTMIDQPSLRAKYGYLRFSNGILAAGQPVKSMPAADFESLLAEAGMTPSQGKVLKAVSLLEGGFDAINTYDTGYVSVGLLQFTTGASGNGALMSVLARMKQEKPDAFQSDFRRFGIDVSATGLLQVVDPSTGAFLEGAEATAKVIDDKRVTAVFQRAGQMSRAFRVAQLEVARDRFLPVKDVVSVTIDGQVITATVGDIVRSEAGLATLMDRKVNRGNLEELNATLAKCAAAIKPKSIADLAAYEREIVDAMFYRRDYLADPTLTQPPQCPKVMGLTSRAGTRGGRGKRD